MYVKISKGLYFLTLLFVLLFSKILDLILLIFYLIPVSSCHFPSPVISNKILNTEGHAVALIAVYLLTSQIVLGMSEKTQKFIELKKLTAKLLRLEQEEFQQYIKAETEGL